METITEKKIQKEEINRQVDHIIGQEASDHLQALHDMYHGYISAKVHQAREVQMDPNEIEEVSFTYESLRDFLRAIVSAEKEFNALTRK